jgi:hypothetical protein
MQALFVDKMYFICYRISMTNPMGRPKLPPESRKTEVFSVRVTATELAKINEAARVAGLEPPEWGRKRLLSSENAVDHSDAEPAK